MAESYKPDGKCPRCGVPVLLGHTGAFDGTGGLEVVLLDPEACCYWVNGKPGDYTVNEAFAFAVHDCKEPKEKR